MVQGDRAQAQGQAGADATELAAHEESRRKSREALLIERPRRPKRRRLVSPGDGLVALWLLLGVPSALLSPRVRWRICTALAGLALLGGRARLAVGAIGRLAGFSETQARRLTRELYAGRLAAQLDLMRGLLRGSDLTTECHGLSEVEAALRHGRGAVLWVSDFAGAGEIVKTALAKTGHRVSHLSREEHGFSKTAFGIRLLNPLRIRYESRYLAERVLFDRMRPALAMRQLLSCLRENRVVSISASAHEGTSLIEGRFLRGRMRLATGALRLAQLARCPVLPVFAMRRPLQPDAFDLFIGPALRMPADLPADEAIMAAAVDYLDRLEQQVLDRPGSWVGWRRLDQLF
jgi:lauroyl/myristoyl acyltransferase